MQRRQVEIILSPPEPHFVGDGFRVHNFIPGGFRMDMKRMSPFLMFDYNSKHYFPPAAKPRGVGVHPHRGFETVTIAYKGRIAHADSAGNSGIIGEGEVQWMTAASGILHKEYHEEQFSAEGGEFQMVQLWVNLPAKAKLSPPAYQGITRDMISRVPLPDELGEIEIIAGEYGGKQGPASTFTPVHLYNVKLRKGGFAQFEFPEHYNTGLLVLEGSIRLNEQEVVPTDHFALFLNEGEQFVMEGLDDALVLVLSGAPILEPIAAHGPFVMNTREEIQQAFMDFHGGKFGVLEDSM
jgi:redox-sensitive bicupin YhaK (pirin superfamily)